MDNIYYFIADKSLSYTDSYTIKMYVCNIYKLKAKIYVAGVMFDCFVQKK